MSEKENGRRGEREERKGEYGGNRGRGGRATRTERKGGVGEYGAGNIQTRQHDLNGKLISPLTSCPYSSGHGHLSRTLKIGDGIAYQRLGPVEASIA